MPDARTIFTGDILFIGGTPIVWAGPLANWIAACDLMLGMDVDTVVPGHGPVTDKAGVVGVRDYLAFVDGEATARFDGRHRRLGGGARHRPRDRRRRLRRAGASGAASPSTSRPSTATLDPSRPPPNVVEQFRRMAALDGG